MSAYGLDAIQRGLSQAPLLAQRELLAATTAATLLLERESKLLYPRALNESANQIRSDAWAVPTGALGVVKLTSAYADVIELGRRPGTGVSREGQQSLAAWAVYRLGVDEKQARGIAFLIARKIRRQGQNAQAPMGRALQDHWPAVVGLYEQAAQRIAHQIEGGEV